MGEEHNAAEQLEALRERGDTDAIARAEELLGSNLTPSDARATLADSGDDFAAGTSAASATEAPDEDSLLSARLAIGEPGDDLTIAVTDTAADDETGYGSDAGQENEEGTAAPSLELDLDMEDADLSSSDDDSAAESAPNVPAPNRVAMDEPLDFDDLEIEEETGGGRGPADGTLSLDEDDEDDELDFTETLVGSGAEADDENGDSLLIADDADQVATKLDLARAYFDMGDGAGAREILEELSGAGTDEQQREVSALLERIG